MTKPKPQSEIQKTYRQRQKERGFEECIVWIPIGTKPEIQALAKKLREAK